MFVFMFVNNGRKVLQNVLSSKTFDWKLFICLILLILLWGAGGGGGGRGEQGCIQT